MMNRRDALKSGLKLGSGVLAASMVGLVPAPALAAPRLSDAPRDPASAEALGFELGTQAWTFRDRSALETLDIAKTLGLKAIEFYPGQPISAKSKDTKVGPDLSSSQRADLLAAAKAAGITPRAFGVLNPNKDEADTRKYFDFAKDLGISVITCEPNPDAWPLVEKLAKEYSIKAACHNHPKPTRYWDPEVVLDSVKDRDAALGACADLGHWTRSALDAPASLKKYEGRLISLHLKDIKEIKGEKIDQVWGTGDTALAACLRELRRQKFKGYMSVEYEHGSGKDLEANVKKSIAFFDATCAAILRDEKKP
jgi:sugar phosphate isomerase/epimerase